MARKATTAKTTKATAAPETAAAKDEPKFGVAELVEASGLQPASVRVALRELGVEKNFGNKYGWNTKKDFDEVVKGLKERSAKRVTAAAPKEEAKPLTAAQKRAAAKKAKAAAEK